MKRKTHRFSNLDKLWILGAGASYDASLKRGANSVDGNATTTPLDKDFCNRIKNLSTDNFEWVKKAQVEIAACWRDDTPFEDKGLEEAIITQISYIEYLNAIQPRRRTGLISNYAYLNNMLHLVSFILDRCNENHSKLYEKLASKIFTTNNYSDVKNRVITFNYDTILDKYILNKYSAQQTYFDRINYDCSQKKLRGERCDYPLLLKLHGSINWRFKTEELKDILNNNINEDNYFIKHIWIKKAKTHHPRPDDENSPCIIPPINNKPITKLSLYKHLWTRAAEYLEDAKDIIICGYSLPPTDTMAQMLFKNTRNVDVKNITIIDPNASVLAKWRSMLGAGRCPKARWHYYSTFREYIEHGSAEG